MTVSPQELVEAAVDSADADGAIAYAHVSASRSARFASNMLTTSGETRRVSLTAVAIKGEAVGSLRSDIASVDGARDLMRKACDAASHSRRAADAYDLYRGDKDSAFDRPVTLPEPAQFFDFAATSLDGVFEDARVASLETFGYLEEETDAVYLATSAGCRNSWHEDRSHFGITAKPADWARSVWSGQTGRTTGDLDPRAALDRCRTLLGLTDATRQVDAGHHKVVLSRSCVADMLIWMYWLMALRDADEGKSVFSDRSKGGSRIGEVIYPESIHLWSDPAAPGVQCLPFVVTSASHSLESVFDSGMPLLPVEWIRGGSQCNLVSTRSYSAGADRPVTPFIGNLILDGGNGADASLDLISEVEHGLYVNCLWYIRIVDPQTALLTGLTRDGVYVIEDGKIVAESNNFRFNVSPVEMLANATTLGGSELATPREFDDVGLQVKVPPMVVNDWNMSTVSDAL